MHQRAEPANTLYMPFYGHLLFSEFFLFLLILYFLIFLKYSRYLREFCGFTKVPDASKITRFKQVFLVDLQLLFESLVDLTEPICQAIDSSKADMTIFDSSGIEAWVTEKNPKFANRIIKQLKAYAKANHFDSNYDPYKAAYGSMPTHASANDQIKQLYVNVHFCYAYKIGIVTNGLGIVRHLDLYNKDFLNTHSELVPNKKSDSPDEDKSIYDARLLIPTLQDFFNCHPLINPITFLGDFAFDSVAVYKNFLSGTCFNGNHFSKAYIPLNSRSHLENKDYSINEFGISCCPNDPSLPMKPEGTSKLRSGVERFKFVCPKMTFDKFDDGKYRRVCHCKNLCTSSRCG